jgi:hypothetical protein
MNERHDELYQYFTQTEGNMIHNDPVKVFSALKMSDWQIVDWLSDILTGPPNAVEERLDAALAELTERYVHHLIDVERGVD